MIRTYRKDGDPLDGRPLIRRESGLLEATCIHGIGHPIAESVRSLDAFGLVGSRGTWGTHGCDGCCSPRGAIATIAKTDEVPAADVVNPGPPDPFDAFIEMRIDERGARMVPAILCGEWVDGISRRGDYAVLRKKAGGFLMLDRDAVKKAAFALGIELARER